MGFWNRKRDHDKVVLEIDSSVDLSDGLTLEIKDSNGRVLHTVGTKGIGFMDGDIWEDAKLKIRAETSDVLLRTQPVLTLNKEVRTSTLRTTSVVASETMDRGHVGIGPDAASRLSFVSGAEVEVFHDNRSLRMRLRISEDLNPGEAELNSQDLVELGIWEGDTGYLEVRTLEAPTIYCERRPLSPGPEEPSQTPHKVMVDSKGRPLNGAKKGFRFWGRRVR